MHGFQKGTNCPIRMPNRTKFVLLVSVMDGPPPRLDSLWMEAEQNAGMVKPQSWKTVRKMLAKEVTPQGLFRNAAAAHPG
jgi:hypothetical protein